jgi:hypothetical protein
VKMCDGLLVTQPSAALREKMEWLDGLYRVRNCGQLPCKKLAACSLGNPVEGERDSVVKANTIPV